LRSKGNAIKIAKAVLKASGGENALHIEYDEKLRSAHLTYPTDSPSRLAPAAMRSGARPTRNRSSSSAAIYDDLRRRDFLDECDRLP